MGLFGGMPAIAPRLAATARQAASNGGLLPDPIVAPESPTSGQGLMGGLRGFLHQAQQPGGFFERLNTFGATLQDVSDGGQRAVALNQQRQRAIAAQSQSEARRKLNELLTGVSPSASGQAAAPVNPNAPIGGTGPSTAQPVAAGAYRPPSLRDALPALLAAQGAGVDVGDYVAMLDKSGPDMAVENGVAYDRRGVQSGQRIGVNLSNVNGTLADMNDPNNSNRFIPDVGPGQEIVYDANRQPMVRNLPGAVQAAAGMEGATYGAREAAQAPYRFVTSTDSEGRPVQTAVSNVAGGSIVGADPVALESRRRQSEASDTRLEALRSRVTAGASQLRTFDTMKQLLPEVIAGPGADQRLGIARALAAAGNQDARRRVAATETYQAQARFITQDLIRGFGANPTEGERKFADQMSGGDVNITPEAMAEGIRLFEARIARDAANLAEQERGGGQSSSRRPAATVSREAAIAELRRRGRIP